MKNKVPAFPRDWRLQRTILTSASSAGVWFVVAQPTSEGSWVQGLVATNSGASAAMLELGIGNENLSEVVQIAKVSVPAGAGYSAANLNVFSLADFAWLPVDPDNNRTLPLQNALLVVRLPSALAAGQVVGLVALILDF